MNRKERIERILKFQKTMSLTKKDLQTFEDSLLKDLHRDYKFWHDMIKIHGK